MKTIYILLALITFSGGFCIGQKTDSINCYIQLQDLYDLDLNRSSIKADFYLNIEYTNPNVKGLALLNGSFLDIDTIQDDAESKSLILRVIAELRTHFDYSKFPLDNQKIEIKIEPYQQIENLILYSQQNQNIIVGNIHLNGWIVTGVNCASKINKYKVVEKNGENEYSYSAVNYEIPIIRENKTAYFFKTFLPSLISILIIYIGFILHHNQIDLKVNLAVGSLFVIISNFIVTQRSLPNVSEFTLIEKINIGTLFIVFATILFFAISFRFKEKLTNKQWVYVNRLYISLSCLFFILMLLILLAF